VILTFVFLALIVCGLFVMVAASDGWRVAVLVWGGAILATVLIAATIASLVHGVPIWGLRWEDFG